MCVCIKNLLCFSVSEIYFCVHVSRIFYAFLYLKSIWVSVSRIYMLFCIWNIYVYLYQESLSLSVSEIYMYICIYKSIRQYISHSMCVLRICMLIFFWYLYMCICIYTSINVSHSMSIKTMPVLTYMYLCICTLRILVFMYLYQQARTQDFSQGGKIFFCPSLVFFAPPPWNCFVQKVN